MPTSSVPARSALFILIALFIFAACGPTPTPQPTDTPAPSATPSFTPSPSPTITPSPLPGDATQTFILSIDDNGYNHLFAYEPRRLMPSRLTNGQWDDITPSLSPDGSTVVFASNRNEYWDLYTLDLTTGLIGRLTDSPEVEGNPAWSPDRQWIVYDTLIDGQLEISILSTVNNGQIIRLTSDPSADQDPVWSPQGRQMAYVSNRSGNNDIWIANLDKPDEGRFVNISNSPEAEEIHPVWSPDGSRLAWAARSPNQPDSIFIWDGNRPELPARRIAPGDWPVWNEAGDQISSRLRDANQDYLVSYSLDGILTLPPTPVPYLRGLDWRIQRVGSFPIIFYNQAVVTPTSLWQIQIQLITDIPNQRAAVVFLQNVQAPNPYLHDAVDEAFYALRRRVILETGWDALASLEDAYTPLTSKLDPGRGQDWLYTGRAFSLNPLTTRAGWMIATREDINGQTYWRIYLRALAQDGSMGEPLRERPWDLNARYNLDPLAYEQGGAYTPGVPDGYWVDFTALAQSFGWQRLPALSNWRTYYKGTQFNEFILTGGLDWRAAMLQLYPQDVFVTPTVVIPPTRTLTVTPTGYRYKSPTPTTTSTSTPRPTFTPSP